MLPDWFTLAAAEVRVDSRLREFQLQAQYDESDFEAEIDRRITDYAPLVIQRLRRRALKVRLISSFDDSLGELLIGDQKQLVMLATKLIITSSILAGMNDEAAQSRAKLVADGRGEAVIGDARLGSAESILKGLEDDLQILAESRASSAGVGAESIAVVRADDCARSTEYDNC